MAQSFAALLTRILCAHSSSPTSGAPRVRGRPRRIAAIQAALETLTADLDEARRQEAEAVISYLASIQAWLTMSTPGGLERFFAELGEPVLDREQPPAPSGPPDFGRVMAITRKHGIEVVGPPPR